ncbi:MAG: ABC transporter ATP-binding protein [Actinobacteria bacterium]|nr:ABC transporter ATP-binding protein [Actinomycetota bacterium]
MSSLEVKDLHVTINGSHILQGVNFFVPENKVTALLGRNGVGKSTTLKAIMGLNPGTGSIKFGGTEIVAMPTHKIVQMGLGYVPEDREIFASLTVKENLSLAERDAEPNYDLVYSLFPELLTRTSQRAGTLSGGQQQMVAIARALLNQNKILVIDEPTKGLAPKLVTEVANALAHVADHSTMLIVEQNLALVKAIAQNIIVMDQGKVVFEGGPENLQDEAFVKSMLGVSGGHK